MDAAKEVRLSSAFTKTYALRAIHADPGRISCSFKVPGHLLDKKGHLAPGAVVDLADELGNACCAMSLAGVPRTAIETVDMSISYLATAKLDDELDVVANILGTSGSFYGTCVQIKNKFTGEVISDGQITLFHQQTSKL